MAWINPTSVGALALIGVAVMGFVPTSAGVSNGVDLPCRAVFAPVAGVDLTDGLTADQRTAVDSWLASRSSDSVTTDEVVQAGAQVSAVCGEAQRTRSVWMILTAVFGVAIAFGLRGWGPSDDEQPDATGEGAHGTEPPTG
ncbi:hypothetical protein SAMN04487788_1230 [Microbacterium testaceum StLB037]|uniref:Uncharacterized protein n=1 Tax=Microbacterium testaceum (strain StLB037) TaxID=979556 RepID=A0A1H0MYE4_MICTS|nr:hypothetical protein [Microbacterium testaceum]SDO85305.1 hypothetical protein SAMN04487788_1230 [Microbacterium testaceum StLB037]